MVPNDEQTADSRSRVALVLDHNLSLVSSALRGETDAASAMAALLSARTAAEAIEQATRLLVQDARSAGRTWQEIGELLAITRQAAQQRFSQSESEAEHAHLAARAVEVVGQVDAAAWDEVTADWDEVMREELGVDQVADAWRKITASAGALRTIGHSSVTRKGPFRIAEVPLIFEHGPMKARVVFNHDDKISGLFVLLPDAP
ncbi:MAG TPA: DUF3887 domain-containing protein [Solirubrobacteraceae bacterium]|nr:DUF3887 domain-containing protein [Solirubrobacteraceae bacterium]